MLPTVSVFYGTCCCWPLVTVGAIAAACLWPRMELAHDNVAYTYNYKWIATPMEPAE